MKNQEFAQDSTTAPNRQNVKSKLKTPTLDANLPADIHERRQDFLCEAEIGKLLDAAKKGRHGPRDHLLMLMMFRRRLRVSEAIALKRTDLDLIPA